MQDNLSQEAECCKISGRLSKTEFYRKIYDMNVELSIWYNQGIFDFVLKER